VYQACMSEQLDKDHSDIIISEKPKYILENKLIKYNLFSGKPKRTGWGFSKVVTILNTLWSIFI